MIALCLLKVQVVKLLITQFSPFSYYFLSLRSKLSPRYAVLERPKPMFSLSASDQVSQAYSYETGKFIVLYI